MANTEKNTGIPFERRVADIYRTLGACTVEHNKQLAGSQIDVYVEFRTPDNSYHRIAIDAKDRTKPVGIGIVREVVPVFDNLRRISLVDEGVIVSPLGFTRPGRDCAVTNNIRPVEIADLEALIDNLSSDQIVGRLTDIIHIQAQILEDAVSRLSIENMFVNGETNGLEAIYYLVQLREDIFFKSKIEYDKLNITDQERWDKLFRYSDAVLTIDHLRKLQRTLALCNEQIQETQISSKDKRSLSKLLADLIDIGLMYSYIDTLEIITKKYNGSLLSVEDQKRARLDNKRKFLIEIRFALGHLLNATNEAI